MLDLRRLRVLHSVSRHGSVTGAAAALGYSGSAVSQQLAALEREIGMPLTERVGRRISLTPAADILVSHTDVLFAQLDAAESEVAELRDQVAGAVTLATFPSAAAMILPGAWAALISSAPHVHLNMREMEPEESLPALLDGAVDIAIAHEYDVLPRPLDSQYERRDLLSDPVLIAVHADDAPDSDAPGGRTLELSSLAMTAFLAPHLRTSCAEMTQRACANAGFVPHVVARATDFNVLLQLVAAGAGVALIPQLSAQHLPAQVRLLSPSTPITRQVFMLSRRGGHRKPAVRVVLDALTEAADQLGPGLRGPEPLKPA